MISLEIFLMGLLFVSTVTSLTTEAVKKILVEKNKTYYANTLAGIVSIIVSMAVGIGYLLTAHVDFNVEIAVYLFALMAGSWLCAMLGYDKVIQTISQFKMEGKGE